MPLSCDAIGPQLGAYCDNELSGAERRAVAEHLAACPSCSALVETDRRLGDHIAGGGPVSGAGTLAERISLALDREEADLGGAALPRLPTVASVRLGRRVPAWAQAAAVVLACLVSAGASWIAATRVETSDQMIREVMQAHVRALLQDNPVQVASSDSHTVKPWFAGRVDVAPDVKDLASAGFPLIGGRLDSIGDKRVGVVVYKHNLHWLNVYISQAGAVALARGAPDGARAEATQNGYNMICWTRAGVTYWAVSDLNMPELRQWQALM